MQEINLYGNEDIVAIVTSTSPEMRSSASKIKVHFETNEHSDLPVTFLGLTDEIAPLLIIVL